MKYEMQKKRLQFGVVTLFEIRYMFLIYCIKMFDLNWASEIQFFFFADVGFVGNNDTLTMGKPYSNRLDVGNWS